jgi:hypothetical protein
MKGEPMKTIFGMTLLVAMSSFACGSAPVEGEGQAAAGPQSSAQSEKPKAEEVNVESKATPEVFRSCSLAQLDACIAQNDGYRCNCRITPYGAPQCFNCQ